MAERFLEDSRVDNRVNNLDRLIEGADGDTAQDLDMFNAPTPGQSLTDEPGSRPWEKPPVFSKPEDAFMAIQTKFRNKKTQEELVRVMDAGMPVQVLTKSITTGGFREGLWNPDIAELLNPPVFMLLVNVARKYEIEPILFHKGAVKEAREAPENLLGITQAYKPEEFDRIRNEEAPEPELTERPPVESTGFMPREGQ